MPLVEDKFTFASDWDTDHEVEEPALEVRTTEIGYADDAGFCPLNHHTTFPPEITGGGCTTWKDVEPTSGLPPSEVETVAVIVAVPTDNPLTITLVLCVNVPVGLTIAADPEIESEMGTVFPEGVTVAVIVAVPPTWT